jgi:hypothetical protein
MHSNSILIVMPAKELDNIHKAWVGGHNVRAKPVGYLE